MGQFADKGHEQLYPDESSLVVQSENKHLKKVLSGRIRAFRDFKGHVCQTRQGRDRERSGRAPCGICNAHATAVNPVAREHKLPTPICIIRHSALTDSNRVVISHPGTPFAHPNAAGSNENMFYSTFCLLAAPADTFYMYARPK
jgi:hypothetical protein